MTKTIGEINNQVFTATPKGLAMARDSGLPQRPGFLRIRDVKCQVNKLVRSEPLKNATSSWRYVAFTYFRDAGPVMVTIDTLQNIPPIRDKKAKALLKYDDFTSQWRMEYYNAGNLDADLGNSVEKDMANLGLRPE